MRDKGEAVPWRAGDILLEAVYYRKDSDFALIFHRNHFDWMTNRQFRYLFPFENKIARFPGQPNRLHTISQAKCETRLRYELIGARVRFPLTALRICDAACWDNAGWWVQSKGNAGENCIRWCR